MSALPEINFKRSPVTLIIAAVAVALELVCTFNPDRRDYYYIEGLGLLGLIWEGQLWRPFTTTLLHGGLLHAAFNVYWLVRFGSALEHRFGSYRYLGLVVLLGYVSMMPQFIVTNYFRYPPVGVVGLSGILYGLLGILIIGRRRYRELDMVCDAATVQFLLFWLVLCVGLTYLGLLPVANTAHVAGLLFGLLYGLAIFETHRRGRWLAAATFATLIVLATLIACPGHASYEWIKDRQQLRQFQRLQQQPPVENQGSESSEL